MRDVIEWRRWWGDRVVWRSWVGVWLLALLLLAEHINGVLQLREPCSLLVDVPPSSLDALGDCLVPHDRFLFLPEPLYFLLNPIQLLLFYSSFDFLSFLIPILCLNLTELGVTMDDLK
jgi:hypothetical protein